MRQDGTIEVNFDELFDDLLAGLIVNFAKHLLPPESDQAATIAYFYRFIGEWATEALSLALPEVWSASGSVECIPVTSVNTT